MSGTVGGAATVTINGTAYNLATASYSPTSIERTTVKGQSGVFGRREMPTQPFITMTIYDAFGLTVGFFNGLTDASIVIAMNNGKIVNGVGMWCVDAQEVNTETGEFSLRFEGFVGSVIERS